MIRKLQSVILTLFSIFLLATPSLANSEHHEQNAGPYQVTIQISPEKPVANQPVILSVIVKNKATGEPVTNANVNIDSDMPGIDNTNSNNMQSMPGMNNSGSGANNNMQNMPGMNNGSSGANGMAHMSYSKPTENNQPIQIASSTQAKADMEPGMYMLTFTPSKPGAWNQIIRIKSPLGEASLNFELEVNDPGPNWILIGMVAGIVVLAGIIAYILKRKKAIKEV